MQTVFGMLECCPFCAKSAKWTRNVEMLPFQFAGAVQLRVAAHQDIIRAHRQRPRGLHASPRLRQETPVEAAGRNLRKSQSCF